MSPTPADRKLGAEDFAALVEAVKATIAEAVRPAPELMNATGYYSRLRTR